MRILDDIRQFLFPRTCPGCDEPLKDTERAVCLVCLMEMPPTGFHLTPKDNLLYHRLAGRVPIVGASALFYFEKKGRVKRIVSSLKYRRNPVVGLELGRMAGEALLGRPWVESLQGVIPVPLHERRIALRGYNQSERLAKGVAEILGLPVLDRALVRKRHTSTQTRKGKADRWDNVADAFELSAPLKGHFLLVDDIITTGATTEACIRALQAEESLQVSLLAMAVAR